jgi:hypothetical protein
VTSWPNAYEKNAKKVVGDNDIPDANYATRDDRYMDIAKTILLEMEKLGTEEKSISQNSYTNKSSHSRFHYQVVVSSAWQGAYPSVFNIGTRFTSKRENFFNFMRCVVQNYRWPKLTNQTKKSGWHIRNSASLSARIECSRDVPFPILSPI